MKILFITRKYPPQVGGMENYSYGLINNIACRRRLIALKGKQYNLIWFLPYSLVAGFFLSWGVNCIYLTDGLLAPVGYLLKLITRKPVYITVHGLDITYQNKLYQKAVVPFIRKMDHVFTVGRATIDECVKRGIRGDQCTFIPNGTEIPTLIKKYYRKDLEGYLQQSVEGKFILLSLGRLVKRKGTAWFVENVMPNLSDDFLYLIAGDGSEAETISLKIEELHLHSKVKLLGRVPDETREMLFSVCDLFIMPNIKVAGDIEGFGIVLIEAAVRGLPAVASSIEGIQDAIVDGKNGFLVESGRAEEFISKINELKGSSNLKNISEEVAAYTKKYYNWKYISHLYLEEIKKHLGNV